MLTNSRGFVVNIFLMLATQQKLIRLLGNTTNNLTILKDYEERPILFINKMLLLINKCLELCDEYSRTCLLKKMDISAHDDPKSFYFGIFKLTACLTKCPQFMLTAEQKKKLTQIEERMTNLLNKTGFSIVNKAGNSASASGPKR